MGATGSVTLLARHGTKAQSGPDAAAPPLLSGGCGSRLSGGWQAGPPSLFTRGAVGSVTAAWFFPQCLPHGGFPQTHNSTGSRKGTRREQGDPFVQSRDKIPPNNSCTELKRKKKTKPKAEEKHLVPLFNWKKSHRLVRLFKGCLFYGGKKNLH